PGRELANEVPAPLSNPGLSSSGKNLTQKKESRSDGRQLQSSRPSRSSRNRRSTRDLAVQTASRLRPNAAATSAAERLSATNSEGAFRVEGSKGACISSWARFTRKKRYSASSRASTLVGSARSGSALSGAWVSWASRRCLLRTVLTVTVHTQPRKRFCG